MDVTIVSGGTDVSALFDDRILSLGCVLGEDDAPLDVYHEEYRLAASNENMVWVAGVAHAPEVGHLRMIEMPYRWTSAADEVNTTSRNGENTLFMWQELLNWAFVDVGFGRSVSL